MWQYSIIRRLFVETHENGIVSCLLRQDGVYRFRFLEVTIVHEKTADKKVSTANGSRSTVIMAERNIQADS